MKISKFKLKNYKGFWEPKEIRLESGFNLVIGQNNSGKTALLEALSLNVFGKPHRSLVSLPNVTSVQPTSTTFEISLEISGRELSEALLITNSEIVIPVSALATPHNALDFLNLVFAFPSIEILVHKNALPNQHTAAYVSELPPKLYSEIDGHTRYFSFGPNSDRASFKFNGEAGAGDTAAWTAVATHFLSHIYFFKAERLNVSNGTTGSNDVLTSNAGNLPEVLSMLKAKSTPKFKRFSDLLNQIFPTIHEVSAIPVGTNQLQIFVYSGDPNLAREDLAIELSESGTGLGKFWQFYMLC